MVKLELVVPDSPDVAPGETSGKTIARTEPDKIAQFVQVAAFSSLDAATRMKYRVDQVTRSDVFVTDLSSSPKTPIHRVRIGPSFDPDKAAYELKLIQNSGLGQPQLITRALSAKSR
jgi:cell division septation protein DedD